jgi:hypothetical protein
MMGKHADEPVDGGGAETDQPGGGGIPDG